MDRSPRPRPSLKVARYKAVSLQTRGELMMYYLVLVVVTALLASAVHSDLGTPGAID